VRRSEGLEEIEIDGTLYEAFKPQAAWDRSQTSADRCESMDYKHSLSRSLFADAAADERS